MKVAFWQLEMEIKSLLQFRSVITISVVSCQPKLQ